MGHCIEAHDLTASKLVANREKDREFATILLNEKLIDPFILLERIAELPVPEEISSKLIRWVEITVEDIS